MACECKFCAELKARTGDTGKHRYQVDRVTAEGTMTMGWQAKPEGGLIEAGKLWPGTTEVRVIDRCTTWVENVKGEGTWHLPCVGPLQVVGLSAVIAQGEDGDTGEARFVYAISCGIFGCSDTLDAAKAAVHETFQMQGIL